MTAPATPIRRPHIEDAVVVLENLLGDAHELAERARAVAGQLAALEAGDRIALGLQHPQLMIALLLLEDFLYRRDPL